MRRWVPLARSLFLVFAVAAFVSSAGADGGTAPTSSDWNDAEIEWLAYEDGIAQIESSGKPGVLVFYTTWCPHCHTYSRVFHAPEVVELSKQFVMIRVDRDGQKAISRGYAKNGNYIPRTLFLDSKAKVDWSHKGSNSGFPYYLDTEEHGELLSLMQSFQAAVPAKAE